MLETGSRLPRYRIGFESRPGHVRMLPVTWGCAVVFAGYSGFLHQLQLASHELATFGIKCDEKENSNSNSTVFRVPQVCAGMQFKHTFVPYTLYVLISMLALPNVAGNTMEFLGLQASTLTQNGTGPCRTSNT